MFYLGLSAFTNYSIRISFSTIFPNVQLQTTNGIFVQTDEMSPCCVVTPPKVKFLSYSRIFSIKWKLPKHPNGVITHFRLLRGKLIGDGCVNFTNFNGFTSSQIEFYSVFELTLNMSERFRFDPTNDEYVFDDLLPWENQNMSFYTYKVLELKYRI